MGTVAVKFASLDELDELASDGASVYMSSEVQEFLTRFGVRHRVASAYNPHSNQRAEGAVKAAKRMLEDNTGPQGTLDTNKFLAAQLAHRNKPDPQTNLSSSEVVFGRRIVDLLPHKPSIFSIIDLICSTTSPFAVTVCF